MRTDLILAKNGLVEIPAPKSVKKTKVDVSIAGTIFSNLAYYGYVLSKAAASRLLKLSEKEAVAFWEKVEPLLKEITGENKNMGKYVVYKNFPKECLEMSQCEYWFKQILMYIGLPNDLFTESEEARDKMLEKLSLNVLHLADDNSLMDIYNGLLKLPARWTKEQFSFVRYFVVHQNFPLNAKLIPFKENLVSILAEVIDTQAKVKISSATDVLRLGVALSDGDVTMKTNTKFKSQPRKYRKFLVAQLENSSALEEDVARDPERWKRFFHSLHVGDFINDYPRVGKSYHLVYNDKARSFNSKVEQLITKRDPSVLGLLQSRPGDFVRRLHALMDIFGFEAVKAFVKIVPKLKTVQLLKIQSYIENINLRQFLTIAPKGNWNKLKVLPNDKSTIDAKSRKALLSHIQVVLSRRIKKQFPKGIKIDGRTIGVKLQTSDSDLTPYGRGTVFEIPDNVDFIRSASYWGSPGHVFSVWYDNSWNFFDSEWKNVDTCCWNANRVSNAAIFSGDPTSSKTADGKACQMIDLYISRLVKLGIRYAVWNILCFSHKSFDESDVFAALQWGEDAQKGKLFEPARCKLAFPVRGANYTKYIAYIDLVERKLVYMDANLPGCVSSAQNNGQKLQETMPAFVEYLDTIPSVMDLFRFANKSEKGTPVLYSDENVKITKGKAYVFHPVNKDNKFTPINLSECLS